MARFSHRHHFVHLVSLVVVRGLLLVTFNFVEYRAIALWHGVGDFGVAGGIGVKRMRSLGHLAEPSVWEPMGNFGEPEPHVGPSARVDPCNSGSEMLERLFIDH